LPSASGKELGQRQKHAAQDDIQVARLVGGCAWGDDWALTVLLNDGRAVTSADAVSTRFANPGRRRHSAASLSRSGTCTERSIAQAKLTRIWPGNSDIAAPAPSVSRAVSAGSNPAKGT
jgi:hypothetical protein